MGTTAEKLAYLMESKEQIKNALETPYNVMRDYATLIKKYIDNQPTKTVTDGICENAVALPVKEIGVDGSYEQGENPSPDNKQDIEAIDMINRLDVSQLTKIPTTIATTFDKKTGWLIIENTRDSISYVNIQVPTKHIIGGKSYKLKVEFADINNRCNVFLQNTNSDYSKVTAINLTITNTAIDDYMNVLVTPQANQTITVRLSLAEEKIKIEDLPYLPYGCIGLEHTNADKNIVKLYPINLNGNTIGKLRDIKDKLRIYRSGKVELVKNIGRYIFTGDENWILSTSWVSNVTNIFYAHMIINAKFESPTVVYQQSNYFKGVSRNAAANNDEESICYSGTPNVKNAAVTIRVNKTVAPTVDDFKAWLKEKYNSRNPAYMDYQLETPQTIQLPNIDRKSVV